MEINRERSVDSAKHRDSTGGAGEADREDSVNGAGGAGGAATSMAEGHSTLVARQARLDQKTTVGSAVSVARISDGAEAKADACPEIDFKINRDQGCGELTRATARLLAVEEDGVERHEADPSAGRPVSTSGVGFTHVKAQSFLKASRKAVTEEVLRPIATAAAAAALPPPLRDDITLINPLMALSVQPQGHRR